MMKPYFMRCAYCGCEVPLNELEHTGNGFITCRDVLACNKRVQQADAAYFTALQTDLKRVETERSDLIQKIEKERLRLGLPDLVMENHLAAVSKLLEG